MTREYCKFVVTLTQVHYIGMITQDKKRTYTLGMKSAAMLRFVGVFITLFYHLYSFLRDILFVFVQISPVHRCGPII